MQLRSRVMPTDALSKVPTVNMAIKGVSPKFTNDDNRVGCLFRDSSYLLDKSIILVTSVMR